MAEQNWIETGAGSAAGSGTAICKIVGAGEGFADFAPLQKHPGDLLIAADGGLAVLQRLGLEPDIVVGDFDSLGYTPTGPGVLRHPVEKDDTDMMLAIRLGLEQGHKVFYIYGGTGGRFDHTLANLQALAYLAQRGAVGYLFTGRETLTALHSAAAHFKRQAAGILSVFAFGGVATGVDITGLQYALAGGTLTPDYPLGVSNHFIGSDAAVRVQDGTLLLAWDVPALPEIRPL